MMPVKAIVILALASSACVPVVAHTSQGTKQGMVHVGVAENLAHKSLMRREKKQVVRVSSSASLVTQEDAVEHDPNTIVSIEAVFPVEAMDREFSVGTATTSNILARAGAIRGDIWCMKVNTTTADPASTVAGNDTEIEMQTTYGYLKDGSALDLGGEDHGIQPGIYCCPGHSPSGADFAIDACTHYKLAESPQPPSPEGDFPPEDFLSDEFLRTTKTVMLMKLSDSQPLNEKDLKVAATQIAQVARTLPDDTTMFVDPRIEKDVLRQLHEFEGDEPRKLLSRRGKIRVGAAGWFKKNLFVITNVLNAAQAIAR